MKRVLKVYFCFQTKFIAAWQVESNTYAKASMTLESAWVQSLKNVEMDLLYSNTVAKNSSARLDLNLKMHPEQLFTLNGEYNNGSIDVDVFTPYASMEHLLFHGDMVQASQDLFKVDGDLVNLKTSETHKVKSSITLNGDRVSSIETILSPLKNQHDGDIVVKISRHNYGLVTQVNNSMVNGSLSMNIINTLNWDFRVFSEVLNAYYETDVYQLNTFMNVQVNGNTTLFLQAQTPWDDLKNVRLDGNLFLTQNSGDVKLQQQLNQESNSLRFIWKLNHMIDMLVKVIASSKVDDQSIKDVEAQIFYRSATGSLKSVECGFDVDIDRSAWQFGSNATIGFPNFENIDLLITVTLPPPNPDVHRFLISYHAIKDPQEIKYIVGYNAVRANINYASDGAVCTFFHYYIIH